MSSGSIDPVTSTADITRTDDRLAVCEAVLFDFDGTLIDTGELILESFRHTTRTVLGRDMSDEDLLHDVGAPLRQQMERFAPGRGDEMVAVYREYNHARHDDLARPFPGVEETLTVLKARGMPLGVVTSKGHVAVGMGRRLIGLDRFIDTVINADDVRIHKPEPYPLLFAAEQMGVDVTRCMYVGDSPHDMMSARRAGAVAVAALWGMFSRERLAEVGPDYMIAEIGEVLDLVDGSYAPAVSDRRNQPGPRARGTRGNVGPRPPDPPRSQG
jgi:pyrophosphatase PpaX